jgi:hypothetical protein
VPEQRHPIAASDWETLDPSVLVDRPVDNLIIADFAAALSRSRTARLISVTSSLVSALTVIPCLRAARSRHLVFGRQPVPVEAVVFGVSLCLAGAPC